MASPRKYGGLITKYRYHSDGSVPNDDAIFVFGSNLAGRHGRGAALVAKRSFNAKRWVGQGRTGHAYAIPTKDADLQVLSLRAIRKHVRAFREYTKQHKELTFFITRIGCGLAGHPDAEIARMFRGATRRCSFPLNWKPFLE